MVTYSYVVHFINPSNHPNKQYLWDIDTYLGTYLDTFLKTQIGLTKPVSKATFGARYKVYFINILYYLGICR